MPGTGLPAPHRRRRAQQQPSSRVFDDASCPPRTEPTIADDHSGCTKAPLEARERADRHSCGTEARTGSVLRVRAANKRTASCAVSGLGERERLFRHGRSRRRPSSAGRVAAVEPRSGRARARSSEGRAIRSALIGGARSSRLPSSPRAGACGGPSAAASSCGARPRGAVATGSSGAQDRRRSLLHSTVSFLSC
jgi:hypothetical protein